MITHIGTSTIVPLDAVTAQDRARAGGKAFNCARLKQAGFPVPDGVIVLSTASDADVATVADHPWFDAQPADASFAALKETVASLLVLCVTVRLTLARFFAGSKRLYPGTRLIGRIEG